MTNIITTRFVTNVVFEPGEMTIELSAGYDMVANTAPEAITNTIDGLVRSGEFCRVRGHSWGLHIHTTLEYAPDRVDCRECKVCYVHQARWLSDWK